MQFNDHLACYPTIDFKKLGVCCIAHFRSVHNIFLSHIKCCGKVSQTRMASVPNIKKNSYKYFYFVKIYWYRQELLKFYWYFWNIKIDYIINYYLRHTVRTGLHSLVQCVPATPWQQAPPWSRPSLLTSSMWIKNVILPCNTYNCYKRLCLDRTLLMIFIFIPLVLIEEINGREMIDSPADIICFSKQLLNVTYLRYSKRFASKYSLSINLKTFTH